MLRAIAGRRKTVLFWGAIAAGLLARLVVLWGTTDLELKIVDEQHYAQLASNLIKGHGLAWAPGEPTSIRPPLYPAFIATIWMIAGVGSLQAVRLVQIVVALLATGLVYLLGRRVYNPTVGSYAAAAFWLYPSLILSNFTILTETLFTFLLVGFVLLSVMVLETPRVLTAVCCGLALGLAALTRSVMWPVPLVLCPLLLAVVRAPVKRRVLVSAAVLAGYAIVVGPWAIRNTRLQGVLTIVDTMGGQNLRMGNFEHTPEDRMWDAIALTGERHWAHALRLERPNERLTEGQKAKWAQAKALAYMRDHPAQTFRRTLIRFADFWGLEREFVAAIYGGAYRPPGWFAVIASAAIVFSYLLVVTTGAAGIWLARPDIRAHALLILPILVIMGIHMIAFGHSRYHLPLIPILALYAAALVTRRHEYSWAQHRTMMMTAGATVCVLLIIWTRQILIVDADRLVRLLNHG